MPPKKDPTTTHYEHNHLVLLGQIAHSLDEIAGLLDKIKDRQTVAANSLVKLSAEHGNVHQADIFWL